MFKRLAVVTHVKFISADKKYCNAGMPCKRVLYTILVCMLLLVTVTSCSSKPVVLATWSFVNATKAGSLYRCRRSFRGVTSAGKCLFSNPTYTVYTAILRTAVLN